jgi:hypothetical protein
MKAFVAALPLVVAVCLVGCKGSDDSSESGSSNLTAAPCDPNAQPPAAAAQGTVMYNPADKDAVQPVEPVEGNALLGKLFETFLTDFNKCPESATLTDLEDAREKGAFVPSVGGKISGSFTGANKQQTLYVVGLGECNASHADNFGSGLLVVVEGGNIVARNPIDGGSTVHRLVDLDGDGRNELVLKFSFEGQGVVAESARVVRIRPEGVAMIKDFGSVGEDSCASGMEKVSKEFTIIRAVAKPGAALPDFKEEKHTEQCPKQ